MNSILQKQKKFFIHLQLLLLSFLLIPGLFINSKAQTNCFPAPQEILTNSNGEAANYNLVYHLPLPTTSADWNQQSDIPYLVNNSAVLGSASFSRVAYYVKLQSDVFGTQWVWVSMDAFTNNINLIGIPTGSTVWQQKVNNMTIYANSVGNGTMTGPSLTTGTGLSGNIEFWAHGYTEPNAIAIDNANDATYDFGDAVAPIENFYGSFQVHNYNAQQTVFGFNGWSESSDAPEDLGIGNSMFSQPDWTFARNSGAYSVKEIYVFVNNNCGNTNNLSVSASAPAISCFNGTTTLTAVASGGSGTYTYSLNGGIPQSSNTFVVGPGTYTVTVASDANTATSNTVVVSNPAEIIAAASAPAIACNNGTTTLTVLASGGTGALSYSLNGGPAQSGNTFTVGADTYTVLVTDANGCSTTSNFVILTNPSPVTVSISAPTIPCNSTTTTLTAVANGGAGNYSYSLNGGPGQPGNTFTVGTGTYTVTVTDGNGCSSTSNTIVVSSLSAVNVSISAPAIPCNSTTTTLTASASGGMGVFAYSLNGGTTQSGNTFTVGAGTYTVTVDDGSGCIATSNTIVVSNASGASVSISAPAIPCNSTTTTLTAVANGGSGFTYSLNGGPAQSSNTFTVGAGTYTVTATASNGCSASSNTIVVANPPVVSVSISAPAIPCNSTTTTLTALANGGSGFTYSLNGGPAQSSNTFTVGAGTYTVTATASNGCTATSNTIVIANATSPVNASASAPAILCNGGTTTLTVIASGGSGGYTYRLNGGPAQSGNTFTVGAGNHSVLVTASNGCTATATLNLTQPSALNVSLVAGTISCNQTTTTLTVNATGGTGTKTYKLNNGVFQASNVFTVGAGTQTVTVKDANGCTASASTQVSPGGSGIGILVVSIPDVFAVNPGGNANTIYLGYGPSSLTLTANPSNGTAPYTYLWSNGATTKSIVVNPSSPGTYPYAVTVRDAGGCRIGLAIKMINVVDARCDKNKVMVCHSAAGKKSQELCVSASAVPAHLAHGDVLGSCSDSDDKGKDKDKDKNKDKDKASRALPEDILLGGVSASSNVYPNPTRGNFELTISNKKVGKVQVEVVNANGMVVETRNIQINSKVQKLNFDLSRHAAGIYLLKLRSGDTLETHRIILQK